MGMQLHHWQDLWSATTEAIVACQNDSISDSDTEELLYILGRDNECEYVRKELIPYPKLISKLAHRAIESDDTDAKWQIAITIADAQLPDAADLIRPFLHDTDEYIRRRALMVFAAFAPKEAEAIAIKNLSDAYEYTRIAALHVLHTVKSSSLDASLDRLASDSNTYVRQNVAELLALST